jgi:hypothetical protein
MIKLASKLRTYLARRKQVRAYYSVRDKILKLKEKPEIIVSPTGAVYVEPLQIIMSQKF